MHAGLAHAKGSFEKTAVPKVVFTQFNTVTDNKDVQDVNAWSLTLVTLQGIVNDLRELQLLKA